MITPRFSCSQTEKFVVIKLHCPAIRAADVEINVDDTLVTIHVNPYFLRLHFTYQLLEDDASSAQYDPGPGDLVVTLSKAIPGQVFDDLDLLSKLLAPRPVQKEPIIEVLSSTEDGKGDPDDNNSAEELVSLTESLNLSREHQEILEAAENDWQLPQTIPDPASLKLSAQVPYGFLNLHSGYFKNISFTENEINELGEDAESCLQTVRRSRRLKHEDSEWDEEHYLADLMDEDMVQELLQWKDASLTPSEVEYTDNEQLTMLNLPRKEYIASAQDTRHLHLTLLTVLFAYAYENRTTMNDPTPESSWTLCSLIPAFSALDPAPYGAQTAPAAAPFTALELLETLAPCYRRSLAFPLYRSYALAEACRQDVAWVLAKGKRMALRWLLRVKGILDHHEVYYVYSKIWIDDFCVWVQSVDDGVLAQISQVLMKTKMPKSMLGWDLEELEHVAMDIQDDQREADSDDESDESSVAAVLL